MAKRAGPFNEVGDELKCGWYLQLWGRLSKVECKSSKSRAVKFSGMTVWVGTEGAAVAVVGSSCCDCSTVNSYDLLLLAFVVELEIFFMEIAESVARRVADVDDYRNGYEIYSEAKEVAPELGAGAVCSGGGGGGTGGFCA